MTGIHPVQIYGHTAQGASTAQVNATRVEQISEWVTMWRGFDVGTRRRIRKVWGQKGSLSGKRPQKMEPSDRPNLCHFLFSHGSGLEAEHTRFVASTRNQCYAGWSSVQQGTDLESFSKDMGMQMWEKAAVHPLSTGMEKGMYHYPLCQEGRVSTDQRRKYHGCSCTGFSCLWSHQRTSPACGWIYLQPKFLCSLRPDGLGHQGVRVVGMSRQQPDQSHTREGIRPPCDTGAGMLGHRSSFVCL